MHPDPNPDALGPSSSAVSRFDVRAAHELRSARRSGSLGIVTRVDLVGHRPLVGGDLIGRGEDLGHCHATFFQKSDQQQPLAEAMPVVKTSHASSNSVVAPSSNWVESMWIRRRLRLLPRAFLWLSSLLGVHRIPPACRGVASVTHARIPDWRTEVASDGSDPCCRAGALLFR